MIEEEIYEIYSAKDENYEPWADYESSIMQMLIDAYDMSPDENWKIFIRNLDLKYRIYPYYIENGAEKIKVKFSDVPEHEGTRTLMQEGMKRHTDAQLKKLRETIYDESDKIMRPKVFTPKELDKIERR